MGGNTDMICLTGDLHHASLRTNDQKHILDPNLTEVRVAHDYVGLLEKYQVKCTLYICGKAFDEEWEDLRPVAGHRLIEVGGHMYRARKPRPLFDWYGEKTGNWNGPRWYQDWDIAKNIEVVRDRMGYRVVSWRAHSYKVDPNTYELMAKHGLKVTSDAIEAKNVWPRRIAHGIISHPMNVIPDHDHLYHAHRTREYVEEINRRGYGADEFGAVSYTIEEWGEMAIEQARAIDEKGGIATILAHPLCMYLADRFKTFEKLLSFIAQRKNIFAREIPEIVDNPPPGIDGVQENQNR